MTDACRKQPTAGQQRSAMSVWDARRVSNGRNAVASGRPTHSCGCARVGAVECGHELLDLPAMRLGNLHPSETIHSDRGGGPPVAGCDLRDRATRWRGAGSYPLAAKFHAAPWLERVECGSARMAWDSCQLRARAAGRKLLSAEATVTGIVSNILKTIHAFEKDSSLFI